jgi:hypothetical protein
MVVLALLLAALPVAFKNIFLSLKHLPVLPPIALQLFGLGQGFDRGPKESLLKP